MKRDGAKRRTSEVFKCKRCEHRPFALVCMVTYAFFFTYLQHSSCHITHLSPSPTSLHHPPLIITTSVTTTINETTATTVTIINVTTNTTLNSVMRPPPSPTSTGRSPWQQSQQQQLDGCSRRNTSRAPSMSFFILLPLLLLMILFQSVIFTIHHPLFTITISHHKSNIENAPKTRPPPQRHVQMLREQQQQLGGLRCNTS